MHPKYCRNSNVFSFVINVNEVGFGGCELIIYFFCVKPLEHLRILKDIFIKFNKKEVKK